MIITIASLRASIPSNVQLNIARHSGPISISLKSRITLVPTLPFKAWDKLPGLFQHLLFLAIILSF